MYAKLLQSCLTLCDPMDYSQTDSSAHGIFRARILEWIAVLSCRGSSQPRDRTLVSCIIGSFFTIWVTREVPILHLFNLYLLCGGYKKSFLPDNHYFLMSDFKKTKASKEMTHYILNGIPKIAYTLPRPWISTRARTVIGTTSKFV